MRSFTRDDLEDVYQLTNELEKAIYEILKDNSYELGISALLSATINSLINQCSNAAELIEYKRIINDCFNNAIITLKMR